MNFTRAAGLRNATFNNYIERKSKGCVSVQKVGDIKMIVSVNYNTDGEKQQDISLQVNEARIGDDIQRKMLQIKRLEAEIADAKQMIEDLKKLDSE